ncbi:protein of unknown function [Pedobacter steynii]|uniref:F5/8 type C domain-containing protein n=1 Tax=Pedobacter steynii TaxID=430522 RepID=A0A1G9JDA1_9SPHI|nr:discoidin domain-containing protein [Pedobacter steynii]NQX38212.1 discoidin domain-containing protein [Pedobacter steynii]SDL35215.1 protein of unknown function [Pedobacter steynii]
MKKLLKLASLALLGLSLFTGCKKNEAPYEELTDAKDGASVYIARFTGNEQKLSIFPYQDEARTFEFGASFGALGLPKNNISVKYAVDDKAFDSLNVQRGKMGLTAYRKFPAEAYQISTLNSTISSGKTTSDLIKVSYFSRLFDPAFDYLLPISIVSADGYKIGTNKTIFLVAPKLSETPASKTGWTVSADSEELVGEGSVNGKATAALDGNIDTYWHSKWQGGELPFPHWLTIDMKQDIYVTRVELAARQNASTGFSRFNIEASNDGSTWISLGTGLIMDPANKAFQSFPVTPGYRRYLKITMTAGATSVTKSTHLAEINVYRY